MIQYAECNPVDAPTEKGEILSLTMCPKTVEE